MKAWKHQEEGVKKARNCEGFLLHYGMGCLSGETEVQLLRAKKGFKISLKELYQKWNYNWNTEKYVTTTKCLINNRIVHSEIKNVMYSGLKDVYKITLSSGRTIKCTEDHLFRTKFNTWIAAKDLTEKHKILINGTIACNKCGSTKHKIVSDPRAKNIGLCHSCLRLGKNNGQYDTGRMIDSDGYVRLSGYQNHPRANSRGQLYEHIAIMEKHLGRYISKEELVHHSNEDRADNRIKNLELTDNVEHYSLKYHGHDNNKKFDEQLNKHGQIVHIVPKYDQMIDREYIGKEETYDICMKYTNNFIANKIVVHNSGKTFTSIKIAKDMDATRILVICPKSVVDVWPKEFNKHVPGEFNVFPAKKGSVKKKGKDIESFLENRKNYEKKVVVVNYESVWRPGLGPEYKGKIIVSPGTVKKYDWDLIIVDEGHRIKAAGSKVSRFMSTVAPRAKKRLALTGTPMPNSPLDIYGLYRFLDKSIFGTNAQRFRMRYAEWGGFEGRQVMQYINQEELSEKIYSIAHRIRTEDVVELPDFSIETIECELSAKAMKMYKEFNEEMILEFAKDQELTAANVLVKTLKLTQLTAGVIQDDEGNEHIIDTAKFDALKDFVIDLPREEPLVIFCRFTRELDEIKKIVTSAGDKPHRTVSELSGRVDELQDWQDGNTDVIVVNMKAGSEGIDLTRARYAVYFSIDPSYGVYEQSVARLKRPGADLSKKIIMYHLVAKGTRDVTTVQAIKNKESIITAISDEIRERLEQRKAA